MYTNIRHHSHHGWRARPESVFVNINGSQESIPPVQSYRPTRLGNGPIGSLKGLQKWALSRILKFIRTPGIDSTESIPCENQFSRIKNLFSEGRNEDPRTKSIPSLKINIYGTWPTQFHTWFLLNSRNRFFFP